METFEKLEVWREGKELAVEIYRSFQTALSLHSLNRGSVSLEKRWVSRSLSTFHLKLQW
jgi:hypothetical protein